MTGRMMQIAIRLEKAGIKAMVTSNKIIATLPMYSFDGNPIDLYITEEGEMIKISDEGYLDYYLTFQREVSETDARNRYIDFVCKTYNVQYSEENAEYYRLTKGDLILESTWSFSQAFNCIADISNHVQYRSQANSFIKQGQEYFLNEFPSGSYTVRADYGFTNDEDDKLNSCDIVLNGDPGKKPIAIEFVSSSERLPEVALIFNHHLFRKKRKILCMVVFDDYDHMPHKSKNYKRILDIGASTFTSMESAKQTIPSYL